MTKVALPTWAEEMRRIFRSGSVSQFIIHGAIFDLVPYQTRDGKTHFMGLKRFMEDVMLQAYDLVVRYDRGTGIRATKGTKELGRFLKSYDEFNGTSYARTPASIPRAPNVALGVLDRLIDWCTKHTAIVEGKLVQKPIRVAVILDYVQFIAPAGGSLQVGSSFGEAVIRLMDWASDPAMTEAHALTVLLTETLSDVNAAVSNSPYPAKLHVTLPTADELGVFTNLLLEQEPLIKKHLQLTPEILGQRLVGLSRVNLRNALRLAARNGEDIDSAYLVEKRRELIEKECRNLLDFIESEHTMDSVAGHTEAVRWLREDTELLRQGKTRSIPMGYLFCGRIGTGKTWLTMCWAGEIGIPCVVFKNFRDKWQGSTEGNLEKIFEILDALGQVMVFVDEADQATGKRDSGGTDSGLSGRVYAMLAKKMSDTSKRGKIIWVFATSRPDLVEVDLKRPGRLDVHIPLFPPQTADERQGLMKALAKKVGAPLRTIPELPENDDLGGNEMEAMLVRARRMYDLQDDGTKKKGKSFKTILEEVIKDFRPMAHTAKLEYMDLVAVKECTDSRFLPPRFAKMAPDALDSRIDELRHRI